MKILELRFKNLNSLYGEWFIDFTDPEYTANGIFALTGPTGAGKSTILDAVCLALYGATPRLGKITKSDNQIMSRQTGECYAEVLFESQAGRFRCHWEQRRARKKADGRLQDQEHQIADADSGKPIETKKSLVVGVIEEKTGMNFDRFTRSILLAQGRFDTFLKADVEQKSRILEQITGTEIYSEISRRVHERLRAEREKLDLVQAETTGIMILEPEQHKEIQLDLEKKQQQEVELAARTMETGKAITWLTSIDQLKREIDNLSEETAQLQIDRATFKPKRDDLELAQKAAPLEAAYAALMAIRKQQADELHTVKIEEEALPGLKSSAAQLAETLKLMEQQTVKAKADLQESIPLIRRVRTLDQKLAGQQSAITDAEESCGKDSLAIDAVRQTLLKEQKKRIEAGKSLELIDNYLKEHAEDEWLIGGLTGIEEQCGSLFQKQKEIAEKETGLGKADKAMELAVQKLEICTKQIVTARQELEGASKEMQQGKKALKELLGDRLLREYRTEKDNLLREMVFLSKIAELEDSRSRLEDGKPCPLCGSEEHPFAEGNIPVPDETERKIQSLTRLITEAEEQEARNRKLEEIEAAARKNLTDREKQETAATVDKKASVKAHADLKDSLETLQIEFSQQKQTISNKLQPLGITEIPDEEISALPESLKKRLDAWQEQAKKKTRMGEEIVTIDSELKRLDAVIQTQNTVLIEKQKDLKTLKKEYATGSDERKQLYGDKNPDHEENLLNKNIANAEDSEKKARGENDGLQRKLAAAKTHIESLKLSISRREAELASSENNFKTVLNAAGFSDEKLFLEARLTAEQRTVLSAEAKKLDDRQTVLKARRQDRETRLVNESARNITDKSLTELEPQLKEYEASLKDLRDTVAALKHRLSEDAAARERIKEKQTIIQARQKECRRWENLHVLIGSADGKKYRNFAQGLTFELMVAHANRQLEKMTDRYLLIRDDKLPLELNVVDNYQAGEIRSTKNLSGGESFIVSLTLALGLSKMASRKVRVDSLFLDEGFGTLDEDALETALDTLAGLQQDNKLIGIISHISALKDRISTQITITPESGGRSTLTGPGCRAVKRSSDV